MRKLLVACFIASFVGCSNDGNDLQEVESLSRLQKSSELSPESEYEEVLSSRYAEYEYSVAEWTEIVDQEGGVTEVKVVTNGLDPIAYLIKDPTDGHYLFAAKNEETETLFVRDFTRDILIDASYEGELPVPIDIQNPDAGTVTKGWFRRFTWTLIGWGTDTGDWGSCIGGIQTRSLQDHVSFLFLELENGKPRYEHRGC